MNEFQFDKDRHIYTLDGRILPSVTQVLECVGMIDTRYFTDFHRFRGSAVHAACHYLDEYDLDWDSVEPQFVPYIKAYERFKEESGFMPETIEQPKHCPVWRFAGTPDRVGLLNGRRVVIDLKNVSYLPAYAIQTAAYAWLSGRAELPRFTVHLKPDATYKLHPENNAADLDEFFAALRVTHWKMEKLKWTPVSPLL